MKPTAFRIYDFKSIRDSGVCMLSADGITVLAGENESGKTAILSALRDFDLAFEEEPLTQDYFPDDDMELVPRVSVCFEVDWPDIFNYLKSKEIHIIPSNQDLLSDKTKVWITRNFIDNAFYFEDKIEDAWDSNNSNASIGIIPDAGEEVEREAVPVLASAEMVLHYLFRQWPKFVYFDAFDDILPRKIELDSLRTSTLAAAGAISTAKSGRQDAPQIVRDFLKLANIDVEQIARIASNEKLLTNYLDKKNGLITGDFLSFWKRSSGPSSPFRLRVAHYRNDAGKLMLAFYIRDTSDQYLDQRSRGFRWFLSFYIRLAASIAEDSSRPCLLLIDEPGSFYMQELREIFLAFSRNES